MPAKKNPAPELTRAQRCTTEGCTKPRIRLNALKCTEHEIVYRAAAKLRAAARKAAAAEAAKAAAAAPKSPRRKPPVREMGSGAVARA